MIQFYTSETIKKVDDFKKYMTTYENELTVFTKSEFLQFIKTGKIKTFTEFKKGLKNPNLCKDYVNSIARLGLNKNSEYIDGVMKTQGKKRQFLLPNTVNVDDEIELIVKNVYTYVDLKNRAYYNKYKLMCVEFGV